MTTPDERHDLRIAIEGLPKPPPPPDGKKPVGHMDYWTIGKDERDPFRMDTPANHRDCQWLVERWNTLGIKRPNHDRGLHYGLLGTPMPLGRKHYTPSAEWTKANADWVKANPGIEHPSNDPIYRNTSWNSEWIEDVVKRARWLGYIPWEDVKEQRNGDPFFRKWEERHDPWAFIQHADAEASVAWLRNVKLPDAEGLKGEPILDDDFISPQKYHIVLCGEKTSLIDILDPIAEEKECSLLVSKGDLTDPLIYKAAQAVAEDGRPAVFLYFSDSDMSGWNMPITLSRKLAAAKLVMFPDIEFRVFRVGLVPAQVKNLDLPQEPLKTSDPRGTEWFDKTGTKATEIDALITQQPDVLRQMTYDAIAHFYDETLQDRVEEARQEWVDEVREEIENHPELAEVRDEVAARFAEIKAESIELADEIKRLTGSVTEGIELPPIPDLPEAEIDEDAHPEPLCDSNWSFQLQTEALLESKRYEGWGID